MPYPRHVSLLPILILCLTALWIVFGIVSWQMRSSETDLDHLLVQTLRQKQNPERMIGPPILEESMRDFTALGGYALLIVTTISFAFFAQIELGRGTSLFFVVTVVGGFLLSSAIKNLVARERPSIVPHLSHVAGATSFPSAHAMMSVIVFMSMGLLMSQLAKDKHLARLLVILPVWLSVVIGVSRVFMGVHYPTDVLGGWSVGLLWTWNAFLVRGVIRRHRGHEPKDA